MQNKLFTHVNIIIGSNVMNVNNIIITFVTW